MQKRNAIFYYQTAAWVILFFSLILTFAIWSKEKIQNEHQAEEIFQIEVYEDIHHIKQRMLNYEHALRSGIGFFQGSDYVSRQEWHQFVKTLQTQNYYPGILGLGYAQMLRPDEVASTERRMRIEGYPGFTLKPSGKREQYSAILYLEPQNKRNEQAIGYDMFSEPVRAEAMKRARDTGRPALSGEVKLIQEIDNDVQPGVLMYLPLYKTGEKTDTLEARRKALVGFIYAPFRMKDLMSGILHNEISFNFEIYDGHELSEKNLLYRSFDPASRYHSKYHIHHLVEIEGRTWNILFSSTPEYDAISHTNRHLLILIGGLFFDLILFIFLLKLLKHRHLLENKNQELESSRHRFKTLLESSTDGIHILDSDGNLILYSNSFINMLGYSEEDAAGLKVFDWDAKLSHEEIRQTLLLLMEKPLIFETCHRRKNGLLLDVEIISKPIVLDGKRYIYASSRDITERREYSRKLEKTTALLKEAQHLAKLGSWQLDLITGVLEWSDEIYNIFEIDKEQINPSYEGFLSAIHPDDRDKVNTAYTHSLQEHSDYTIVHRLLMPDGRVKYVREQGEHYYSEQGTPIQSRGTVHDITEQIEFLHTIENDRERFKMIAELGADWYWETDELGRYTHISPNVEKTLGYSAKELLGKSLFDFISSETLKQQFRTVINEHQTFSDMTVLAIRKDGSEAFLETRGTPILNKNGQTIGYRGIDKDITEKKSLEIKLIEHNTELNTIFDTSKDGIAIIDFETKFLDFNNAFIQISGYSSAELLHKSCLDLTPPEEVENTLKILRLIREGKEIKDFEKTLIDKAGNHHTISLTLSLMPDHKRILANLKDITDQKAKSNELSELYDRLRLATDAADIGIWVWNLKDNSLVWDEKMFKIFEIPAELHNASISYNDWKNAVHPDDIENAEHELYNAVHTMAPFDTSFRIIVPNGTVKYIQATSVVKRDPSGKALTMIGINRDITADRTLQEALTEAKEAAENANKAKSDFLANMSHEIRTPLNGIIGLTELVLQSNLTPLQRDYLTKSEKAAEALLNVLNGILDYSKIEVQKLRLESIPFSLHELLDNLNALFSYKAEEKNIALITNVDPNVPDHLIGDPLRLMQILINLVGNALKFTDSGSVVITISALSKGENLKLRFEIADTGIGMTAEHQKNLFEPFYQADSSITRQYGGTGLGLMISKELITLMGGEITLSSTLHHGTTFMFTADFKALSASDSSGSLSSAVAEENALFSPSRTIHILLVEDNDLNQLVATERLKQMGLSVSVANNGLEAVEMVKESDFDAILMDLQMPVMDGFEASKAIRAIEGKKSIPIIALSAAVMQQDRKLAMEAGMNDHISKPIDKKLLHHILTKWLIV